MPWIESIGVIGAAGEEVDLKWEQHSPIGIEKLDRSNLHTVYRGWVIHQWASGHYCAYPLESTTESRKALAEALGIKVYGHRCDALSGPGWIVNCFSHATLSDVFATIYQVEQMAREAMHAALKGG